MPLLVLLALAALAGVVTGLGFPPFGVALLLPAGAAALTLLCRGSRLRRGFGLGWVFGTAFMLTLMPWLQVIGADAWIMLSVFEGLYYGLLGLATAAVARLPGWPLWTACCWVGAELLRSIFPFGGFPWGRLAFGTAGTPLAPLFAYLGTGGVTFAVALLGTVLAWAVLRVRRVPVRAVAAVVVTGVLVSLAYVFPLQHRASGHQVTVAAVQGDVPGIGLDAFAQAHAVVDNHVHATERFAAQVAAGARPKPDLVIWPESSTDIDPFRDPGVYQEIQGAVDRVGVPVLVGAMVLGPGPHQDQNEGIVWSPRTGPGERYAKQHPVPFGEYIPLRSLIAPYFRRLDQIPYDMLPGTRPGLVHMAGVKVGDLICFEVAWDDLLRTEMRLGAQVVTVQTNNATYMGTGQLQQQFAIARLRAIESDRYVVVAATNGISGIVAPDGHVVDQAPVRTQRVLVDGIELGTGLTPGVRFGGWVDRGLALIAGISVLAGLLSGYRRRRPVTARAPHPGLAGVGSDSR
ncbi:MAG TPA: apolipoprotein N-acyltransferase [Nocardioidaceae bacterium]|nr:apolipoprotein N-acyltransferase [Nocardioidaceae bacterium]